MIQITADAIELVAKLEEAARQAEIANRKWLVEQELYRRQEDARRIDQSIKESRDDLARTIQQWAHAISIEQFFVGVEERAHNLAHDRRLEALSRLAQARKFLGSLDPLEFFMAWKTPSERYDPKYPKDVDDGNDAG